MRRLLAFLLFLGVAAGGWAEPTRTVVFICEKGSVKSVLAAKIEKLAEALAAQP